MASKAKYRLKIPVLLCSHCNQEIQLDRNVLFGSFYSFTEDGLRPTLDDDNSQECLIFCSAECLRDYAIAEIKEDSDEDEDEDEDD